MEANGLACDIRELPEFPDSAVVVLRGTLDGKNVTSFKTWMESLSERGIQRLAFDLEALKYVNSTGIAYLINLAESRENSQGAVSLSRIQPKVKIILETLGVLGFFKIHSSPEAALGEFKKENRKPSPVRAAPSGARGQGGSPAPRARATLAGPAAGARVRSPEGPSVLVPPPEPAAPSPPPRSGFRRFLRRMFGLH
jgi:anti-anti-sigma factor